MEVGQNSAFTLHDFLLGSYTIHSFQFEIKDLEQSFCCVVYSWFSCEINCHVKLTSFPISNMYATPLSFKFVWIGSRPSVL